ncbi:DNA primase [Novosphingobium tardum]|uniref:DNA primase n=1 Tax=Novosphingobium tardum TaxID=1538021 RepID=A0ABV8RQD8_9SPHN
MLLSPAFLDELRSRISLSAVIGRTTRLTKAGREFKACCPFHNEKSPSFTVNDEKGFYHCFGCGAHGDAIRWMTDQRGLAFMDAVKELAAEARMDVPAADPRAAARAEQAQTLSDVTTAAQTWFVACLAAPEGAAARRYLEGRGFPADIVERFGFGFAPDSRTAMKDALRQIPGELLVEAGLRIKVDDKEPYDRFRGRLMLPIRNPRGTVIGFGGRILDPAKTDAPKYLNSPDTPLFDKGRTLYNLDRAGPLARKSGRLVVVEGYMDVVALAAAGIEEAVAPLGTALTEAQIELLWRVCETPVLCFDGDAAGQRAARRAIVRALPLLRPAHSLAIATLPAGLDPDDLIKQRGSGAMLALLGEARSLVETLWDAERTAAPLVTPEDKAGLKARLLEHVATIQDTDIKALYRRDLLDRYDALAFAPRPSRTVDKTWTKGAPQRPFAGPLSPASAGRLRAASGSEAQDTLFAAVIAGFIRHPSLLPRHGDALARMRAPNMRLATLIEALLEVSDGGALLEPGAVDTILAQRRIPPVAPSDYAGKRFAFLDPAADSAAAAEELAAAVAMLVERPALREAKEAALARFVDDPEGASVELKRLNERELAFERRLMQRATARAGNDHELNGQNGGNRKD